MSDILVTVGDYVASARTLLQDLVAPYRYSDDDLITGLNLGLYEATRLRPDIFLDAIYTGVVPASSALSAPNPTMYSSLSEAVATNIPPPYRLAFTYYIVGNAQLRDSEEVQDARASQFLNKFTMQLLDIKA